MLLPRWIPFAVAFWVIAFGILRIRIALRKDEPEDEKRPNFRKGGYYARSKRSHLMFGVFYLLLGAYCIAMGFGYGVDLTGGCMNKQTSIENTDTVQGDGVRVETRD